MTICDRRVVALPPPNEFAADTPNALETRWPLMEPVSTGFSWQPSDSSDGVLPSSPRSRQIRDLPPSSPVTDWLGASQDRTDKRCPERVPPPWFHARMNSPKTLGVFPEPQGSFFISLLSTRDQWYVLFVRRGELDLEELLAGADAVEADAVFEPTGVAQAPSDGSRCSRDRGR